MPKRRDEQAPYWQQLRVAERSIIEFALEHGQTIRGAARLLGISPNYLGERVRELGIPAPEVRPGPKPGTKRPTPPPTLRVVPTNDPPPETLDEDVEDEDELEDEDEEGTLGDDDGNDADDLPDEDEDEDDDENEGDGEIEDASTGN